MPTKKNSQPSAADRAHQNFLMQCKSLFDGISKEAWEIISQLAKEDSAVFQFREPNPENPKLTHPVPYDAQTIVLIAASNDGRQTFFKTLRAMRETGESISKS